MKAFALNKDDVVLVVIDLQERLMKAMKDREKVYKNTRLLLTVAYQLSFPVVVTEQYPKGLGPTVPEIKECLEGYEYIEKVTFTACGQQLIDYLKNSGRKTVIITGSETHVCVFQTVRDLTERGYNVHVVKDAVCSRFEENYENGIALMKDAGAIITNTETVVFDLLKLAGTPEFKAISPLLK
jgi:nicotinamidase-related amidase